VVLTSSTHLNVLHNGTNCIHTHTHTHTHAPQEVLCLSD